MTNIYFYILAAMSASVLLCVAILLFYLKYKKNMLHQQYLLQVAEVQYQKALLHAVISSQERERKRIGMDLHDEVGSVLASLRMMIEHYNTGGHEVLTATAFNAQCKTTIDSIMMQVRNISHNLSPLVNSTYGFYDALQDFCEGINKTGKLSVRLDGTAAVAEVMLGDETALALYRVLTELISNTIRHSGAGTVILGLSVAEGCLLIDYRDDGTGFAPAPEHKGMGLRNIESRLDMIGATYVMDNSNTGGFHTRITLPL